MRPDLTPLIPGFYADAQGRLYLNMGEFLSAYQIPDSPEVRVMTWGEIRDIFTGIEITEITD